MVQWLRQRAHNWVVVGSNPVTVYWMVVSDVSYYNWKIMKIKVAKWGTPKKRKKESVFEFYTVFRSFTVDSNNRRMMIVGESDSMDMPAFEKSNWHFWGIRNQWIVISDKPKAKLCKTKPKDKAYQNWNRKTKHFETATEA